VAGVGTDLKRLQLEERKRMINEAKQRKEAKRKEEKERKKKEDDGRRKKKDDKKFLRRSGWWRSRIEGNDLSMKEVSENSAEEAEFSFSEELKNKRENDHHKIRERMRIYEEMKRKLKEQAVTCPHCHFHFSLPSDQLSSDREELVG